MLSAGAMGSVGPGDDGIGRPCVRFCSLYGAFLSSCAVVLAVIILIDLLGVFFWDAFGPSLCSLVWLVILYMGQPLTLLAHVIVPERLLYSDRVMQQKTASKLTPGR